MAVCINHKAMLEPLLLIKLDRTSGELALADQYFASQLMGYELN